jgi:hypothetical protein
VIRATRLPRGRARIAGGLLLATLLAAPAFAQKSRERIGGRVMDVPDPR